MKPPFRLVPDGIPEDIDGCLTDLYENRDDLIGFAFVAMYKQRRIVVNAAGEAIRSPIFARGAVASLDDFFKELIQR